ncbi:MULTISPECIES: hypothetical protein [Oxalobacteraceae]|uniref:hypothetical protein n=1 Tax=Oxalobacteraceae TaxID=75682 RepID=UPI0010A45150|nr:MULTISPECIES: hypothetical protein [Oxalobacteraceae]
MSTLLTHVLSLRAPIRQRKCCWSVFLCFPEGKQSKFGIRFFIPGGSALQAAGAKTRFLFDYDHYSMNKCKNI